MNWDIGLQSHTIDSCCQYTIHRIYNKESYVIASFGMPIHSAKSSIFCFSEKNRNRAISSITVFVDLIGFLFYFTTKFNLKNDLI